MSNECRDEMTNTEHVAGADALQRPHSVRGWIISISVGNSTLVSSSQKHTPAPHCALIQPQPCWEQQIPPWGPVATRNTTSHSPPCSLDRPKNRSQIMWLLAWTLLWLPQSQNAWAPGLCSLAFCHCPGLHGPRCSLTCQGFAGPSAWAFLHQVSPAPLSSSFSSPFFSKRLLDHLLSPPLCHLRPSPPPGLHDCCHL